jgi:UMF1 family MFS transporter
MEESTKKVRASKKEIFGWAMFDFANQGYTLLITTVIFPVLFTMVIVGDADQGYRLGNLLWSVALAISYLLVVITGPVFGAIMDFSATKKKFLFYSYILTVVSTYALYYVEPGFIMLGVVLLIVSNFAYAVGENFIAAFLTDLGPPEDLGKISGFGWALGYVGGLVSAGFVIVFLGDPTLENFERIRWVGPFAGIFFLFTAIPTFLWVKERGTAQLLPSGYNYLTIGFKRLGDTLREVGRFKDLAVLLLSIFFSMAAIYIIITFAFIYGDQVIGWDSAVRIYMFIIVQITAALGAVFFGILQDKIGAKITYIFTLVLWTLGIILIYITPQLTAFVNQSFDLNWQAQYVFITVAIVAGLSLGSSQSAGRALVGMFSPDTKAAEFFGFWGLSNKLAGVFGLIGLGVLQAQFGLQNAILICALFFILAIIVCVFVKQDRGMKAAEEYNLADKKMQA